MHFTGPDGEVKPTVQRGSHGKGSRTNAHKPYLCHACGKGFTRTEHVVRHQKVRKNDFWGNSHFVLTISVYIHICVTYSALSYERTV